VQIEFAKYLRRSILVGIENDDLSSAPQASADSKQFGIMKVADIRINLKAPRQHAARCERHSSKTSGPSPYVANLHSAFELVALTICDDE
jgi:hypothetical protein